VERTRRRKSLVFGLLLLAVGGAWILGAHFDEQLLRAFRRADDPAVPVGPVWLHEAARDVTALGSWPVLALVVGAVAGYLALQRQWRAVLVLFAAVGGAFLLNLLLKGWFERPRPDVVPALTHMGTYSFPSGHSLMSAVTYLTLGALADRFEPNPRLRTYAVSLALAITLLVGTTRVFLGAHYPTDVLAGWTVGLAWAGGWWLALTRFPQAASADS